MTPFYSTPKGHTQTEYLFVYRMPVCDQRFGYVVHHLASAAQPIGQQKWGKCLHLHVCGSGIL